MLTSIEVRTKTALSLTIDLEQGEDSEYYIKHITNLDPVKAEITSTGVASADGTLYQESKLGARNPVFTFGVQDIGEKTIRQLRQAMYNVFMPKMEIDIIFYDDEAEPLRLSGRVESFEFPLFQRDPEATLSVICFDPAFYELDRETQTIVVPNTGVITDAVIDYNGSIEVGFTLELDINMLAGVINGNNNIQFTLNKPDGKSESVELKFQFASNDKITMISEKGKKSVTLNRANKVDSILYAMTYQSDWLSLSPGSNNLSFSGLSSNSNPMGIITVSWTNKYGGL